MSAVLVLPGTAPEAEWLEARRRGITASEIAVVMGLSPYSSPYALYHQKTGDLPGEEENDAMRLGSYMEGFVADRFAERHPEFGLGGDGRTLWAHMDRPWQMATPDRIVFEAARISGPNLAVLECKIDGGSDGWGDDGTDEIPVHYRCQVLWQLDVMGVTTGFVACLFLHSRQVRVYELTMDDQAEADLELMRNEANDFLYRIRFGFPPEVDWRPATSAALKRLHPDVEDTDVIIPATLGRRYRAACAAYRKAEHRRDLAVNQVRARLASGHRAVLPDGELVARRDVYDVKEHVRKASHVDKLVPVKPKEAKS